MKASWSFCSVCGNREEHEWVSKSYKKKKTRWRQSKNRGRRKLAVSRTKGNERKKVQLWCDDGGWGWGVRRRSVTPGVSQTLAALQFVALLAVGGGRDADVHHVVARRLVVCRSVCDLLLRHDAVDFCNDNNKDVRTDERKTCEVFVCFCYQDKMIVLH